MVNKRYCGRLRTDVVGVKTNFLDTSKCNIFSRGPPDPEYASMMSLQNAAFLLLVGDVESVSEVINE